MCLLAIQYRLVQDCPILVASNREEFYDRPSHSPTIQSGKPRILCPTDQRAGGTWLGVNQHGMFVGLSNRRSSSNILGTRSRGLLCKEVLRCPNARRGVEKAIEEFGKFQFEPFNLVVVDREYGFAIYFDNEPQVVEMHPGLNIIGTMNMNDLKDDRVSLARRLLTLQTLDSPVKFLAVASKVFARTPTPIGKASMIQRGTDFGTVSSTLIAIGNKPRDAIFQYSDGPADKARYEDYSPLLRDILSRGLRESRVKVSSTTS